MHSVCLRLSHHLKLSLIHSSSATFSLFLSPSSYTLTFLPTASLCLSVSCWYASLSFSICTLSFLAPMQSACHSWDAYLSFSLFLTISLDLWLPLWLAACLFLFLSLCTFLAVSLCLPLPPTLHLSLSALLHLSINMFECLLTSDRFF